MSASIDRLRVDRCFQTARSALLAKRNSRGFWEGRLSSSALSTATAVMALEMARRPAPYSPGTAEDEDPGAASPTGANTEFSSLVERGIAWIVEHQNADGGWGDTTKSVSNISTTMLCHAALLAAATTEHDQQARDSAARYIDRSGGISALRARYGKDKTFSVPILTHCALAGTVDWSEVSPLPFELACLPPRFYKWVRLPVVSYALPALIAIGQARHHFVKPRNPLVRWLRDRSIGRTLAALEKIQPASGGFLEATPLTSFVTMSLAGIGLATHPVARRGLAFLVRSVRADGSWPIDTNLATWLTTLSINALGSHLPGDAVEPLRTWLLDQQYRDVHPYTSADPGGWAWTDLPGGVPDADDTAGAILALVNLTPASFSDPACRASVPSGREEEPAPQWDALVEGWVWLLGLQNRDGGWPTFCRGWGALPFDRSAPDLTAHAIRAHACWVKWVFERTTTPAEREVAQPNPGWSKKVPNVDRAFAYLERAQRPDGSWLPLWFGNQYAASDENPTYGTAKVLAAYRDADRLADPACRRGLDWLTRAQNSDGGWGGAPGVVSSVEETALALEVLISLESSGAVLSDTSRRGLEWLMDRVEQGKWVEPSPIGFYFAKLWYFEDLYPLIFAVAALRRAVEALSAVPGKAGWESSL